MVTPLVPRPRAARQRRPEFAAKAASVLVASTLTVLLLAAVAAPVPSSALRSTTKVQAEQVTPFVLPTIRVVATR
jgi:hypothetical protein